MKLLVYFALVVLSVVFVEVSGSEVTIREFHECVACNADDQARTDFDACLSGLSSHNKEIWSRCCESSFDHEFCKEVALGKSNYATVCKTPTKGHEVELCFWKEIYKNGADIEPFAKCKSQIQAKYCTVVQMH